MAVRRHAPKITPLISAGVLLLTTVFLLHRLHPGGAMAVIRGETPKPVSAAVPEVGETVAWGASDGVQIGVTLSKAGNEWIRVLMRNASSREVMLASGMEPERSGRLVLVVRDKETGQAMRSNAMDPASAFRVVLPPGETIGLAARLPGLKEVSGAPRTYVVHVGWTGPVERRVGGEIHGEEATLESGTLHLSRPWPAFVSDAMPKADRDLNVGIEDTRIQPP
jgi:hypothetical protein